MPDVVVKVGGGLLRTTGDLDIVLSAIAVLSRSCALLIVPGGGPFADAVRAADRNLGIPDEAGHWMAVLAMDQYAHLLAARGNGVDLVSSLEDARRVLGRHNVPVLAPYEWLRKDDPLPHTWDVTSDSIAAWVAGASGARELVLVKPRGATGGLLDRHFALAIPPQVRSTIAVVEQVEGVFREIAARVGRRAEEHA